MSAGVAYEQRLVNRLAHVRSSEALIEILFPPRLSSLVIGSVISTISFIQRILIRCVVYAKLVELLVSCEH
jgi:hypothetical protein